MAPRAESLRMDYAFWVPVCVVVVMAAGLAAARGAPRSVKRAWREVGGALVIFSALWFAFDFLRFVFS